jgi:hypothetical protein
MMSRLAFALLSCVFATSIVSAQDKPAAKPAAETKAEVYVLVKSAGKVEAMTKADAEAKKAKAAEAFKAAKAKWQQHKQEAEAAKKEYTEPAPQEVTVEVMPTEYPTREAAEAAAKNNATDKGGKKGGGGGKGKGGGGGGGKGKGGI